MHAYLLTGRNTEALEKKLKELCLSLEVQEVEFAISKIKDVRDLAEFTRLKVQSATAVLIRDFDNATQEAQSAFLKNLEEPQEDLVYILTAASADLVIPTIASRCSLIEVREGKTADTDAIETARKFMELGTAEKLAQTAKITDRQEAIEFVEKLLTGAHAIGRNKPEAILFASAAASASSALRAYGNVQLTLTAFVVSL